jgi:hypothetical protein
MQDHCRTGEDACATQASCELPYSSQKKAWMGTLRQYCRSLAALWDDKSLYGTHGIRTGEDACATQVSSRNYPTQAKSGLEWGTLRLQIPRGARDDNIKGDFE